MSDDSAFFDELRDRYVVEREIGRGGMATVYLAHEVRHRRPVALKVLRGGSRRGARPGALPARDRDGRAAPASAHPAGVRLRRVGRAALVHDALRGRREPPRAAEPHAAARAGGGAPHRARGRARARITPTGKASSIATSSPRTSCSPGTAARSSPTSASPGPPTAEPTASPSRRHSRWARRAT